jgi:hypothetical protein
MRTHFRERWNLDENLYLNNIDNNMKYLDQILAEGEITLSKLFNYLKRSPLS